MDDWIGKQLAQYQISRQIGRGGMAVVYQAWQPALGRHVAIKLLPPQFTLDQQFLARFRREARSAAQLKHPHIVTIHDVGEQDGIHFIVMEYLEGQSLYELIKATGPMSLERAARIADQVAAALDYAHQRGFVHRDIKPANIIVGPNDHATLTDFGIAKALLGTSLTQSGMMIGTPQYMAPEQIQGAEVDSRTDVYALGIVCYEMLTGVPPFVGDTAAVLYAQAHTPPPALRAQLPALPDHVEAAVNRALAKDPAARFERAGALADALSSRTALVPPSPTLPPSTVRTPAPQPTPSRRPLWILVGSGAVAAVLAVCLLLFMLVRGDQEEATPTAVAQATVTATPAEATIRPTMTNPPPTEVPAPQTPTSPSPTAPPPATVPPTVPPTEVAISNGRIVFVSDRDGNSEIYTMNHDGSDQRRLTNHPADDDLPAASPDGQHIAFQSQRDGNWEIYVMSLDDNDLRRITADPGTDRLPNWSPDGQWLIFSSDRNGNFDLYTVRTDGTAVRQLTDDGLRNGHASWSPQDLIVFNSGQDDSATWEIVVVRSDGNDRRQLTHNTINDWAPNWSPNGRTVLFLSRRDGDPAIYLMDADGSNPHRLYDSPGYEWGAVFSHDGQQIAFTSDQSGDDEIYVMSAAGSDVVRLTFTGGWYPSWASPPSDTAAAKATATAVPSTTPPAGPVVTCVRPIDDYSRVEIDGEIINRRTEFMLDLAVSLYEGPGDLKRITQGSYTDAEASSFGTHAGGGAVDISIRDPADPSRILRDEVQDMVLALRRAGFAAWFRDTDDLYPGSPLHIHAIAVGDRELSEAAQEQLTGPHGYFRGMDGLPHPDDPQPDPHGGPVLCDWMLELGYPDERGASGLNLY